MEILGQTFNSIDGLYQKGFVNKKVLSINEPTWIYVNTMELWVEMYWCGAYIHIRVKFIHANLYYERLLLAERA